MGRLAGFRYREIVSRLKALGFGFARQASGSHEIWLNPATRRLTTIPNHPGDMPEGTLRAILKQADVEVDVFCVGKPALRNDYGGHSDRQLRQAVLLIQPCQIAFQGCFICMENHGYEPHHI